MGIQNNPPTSLCTWSIWPLSRILYKICLIDRDVLLFELFKIWGDIIIISHSFHNHNWICPVGKILPSYNVVLIFSGHVLHVERFPCLFFSFTHIDLPWGHGIWPWSKRSIADHSKGHCYEMLWWRQIRTKKRCDLKFHIHSPIMTSVCTGIL